MVWKEVDVSESSAFWIYSLIKERDKNRICNKKLMIHKAVKRGVQQRSSCSICFVRFFLKESIPQKNLLWLPA